MRRHLSVVLVWLHERSRRSLALQSLGLVVLVLLVLGLSASVGAFARHRLPPLQAGSGAPSTLWYFAEGYTGSGYTEYLTLANFNASLAHITITYYLGSGSPITKTYSVPATARSTLTINNEVGANQNVGMVVSSDQPIVAERPMYFNAPVPSGSDVLGATHLGTTFYFAYLDTTAGHSTYLSILNPTASSMTATVSYTPASGGTPLTSTHTVAATSRGTITVNSESGLASGTYWASVTLSVAGLVERPLYLTDPATGYTGAATVVGGVAPQQSWSFAEGYSGSTFAERYLLANPNASTPAIVTLTFFPQGSATLPANTAQLVLAPGQLQILNVDTLLGGGVNNSAQVSASVPILADRFISFNFTSSIPGATETPGTPTTGSTFYFAEGYTGSGFTEYLNLFNPGSTTATVQVTYVRASGGTVVVPPYTVSPQTRTQVNTGADMPNQAFSMQVQVTSGPNIVAERVMYFNFTGGDTGGSAVIGYQGG